MTAFKSYSQAAQDRFVQAVLGNKHGGTFLDVGCCHPTELSNSYALENHFAWRGLLVDSDPGAIKACREQRLSPAILADSTKLDFDAAIREAWKHFNKNFGDVLLVRGMKLPDFIDYLSLDVDAATTDTLENLMRHNLLFRVVTVEHDAYRFGDGPRRLIEDIMQSFGYALVCKDVCSAEGYPFEHWYVHPSRVPSGYEQLRCEGKRWTEIFPP